MNVVTSNKNKEIIDQLNIEIIKRVDGQFELRELLSKFVNLYFNKMIIDITSIENYQNTEVISQLAKAIDPSRVILLLTNEPEINSPLYMSNLISCGFYNFTRNFEGIEYLYKTPNSLESVKHLLLSNEDAKHEEELKAEREREASLVENRKRRIIGLSNLTNHAGASSLTNMMVRQLNDAGFQAIGIEMFKQDLIFYRDDKLFACMNKQDLENKLRTVPDIDAVIIDLNEFGEADKFCDDILYLVEPSYVMVTKLLKRNKNAFLERKNDKVVLNKSFVNDQDIPDFEYETKCKIFDNLPPMNDRDRNLYEVNQLLTKLGYNMSNVM